VGDRAAFRTLTKARQITEAGVEFDVLGDKDDDDPGYCAPAGGRYICAGNPAAWAAASKGGPAGGGPLAKAATSVPASQRGDVEFHIDTTKLPARNAAKMARLAPEVRDVQYFRATAVVEASGYSFNWHLAGKPGPMAGLVSAARASGLPASAAGSPATGSLPMLRASSPSAARASTLSNPGTTMPGILTMQPVPVRAVARAAVRARVLIGFSRWRGQGWPVSPCLSNPCATSNSGRRKRNQPTPGGAAPPRSWPLRTPARAGGTAGSAGWRVHARKPHPFHGFPPHS